MRTVTKKTHGQSRTRLHDLWGRIKVICNNKNHRQYKDFGGAGFTYDSRWDRFEGFYTDMCVEYAEKKKEYENLIKIYGEGLIYLDLKDGKKHFSKENCIFKTRKINIPKTSCQTSNY